MTTTENQQRLQKIKAVVFDVDGVMTDSRIFLDAQNRWTRLYSVRDGQGIVDLRESGYMLGVITGAQAFDVEERMRGLGIHHVYMNRKIKTEAFEDFLAQTKLAAHEVAYMGDDHPDVPLLKRVGFAATVKDAMPEVLENVHFIAERPAGLGAARELCELVRKFGFHSSGKMGERS